MLCVCVEVPSADSKVVESGIHRLGRVLSKLLSSSKNMGVKSWLHSRRADDLCALSIEGIFILRYANSFSKVVFQRLLDLGPRANRHVALAN